MKKMFTDGNKNTVRFSIFLTILLMILFIVFSINLNKSYVFRLNAEYKIVEINDSIFGLVSEIEEFKGEVNVTLKNDKYWLKKSRNYSYPEIYLSDFLQIGDSIYKPKGTDTLFIYKDDEEYYFILGKIINRN